MVEFELMEMILRFSDGVMNFAKEKNQYIIMRKNLLEEFTKTYNNYGSADVMLKNIQKDSLTFVLRQVDANIKAVTEQGCYDVDQDIYLDDYFYKQSETFHILEAIEDVVDKFNEIGKNKEEIEEYRRMRKASRGRFVGGGFGMAGAAKGIVGASALNMATGLGHSAINLVGNIGTGIAASGQKRALYKSDKTRDTLKKALRTDLDNVFWSYLRLLEDKFHMKFEQIPSENSKRVSATISNISGREMSDEELEDLIPELFRLDPFNEDLFRYILDEFGDPDLELEKLAEWFCPDLDAMKYEELYELVRSSSQETYEDCQNLLQNMEQCIQENGILPETYQPLYDKVQARNDELRRIACTFEDVLYETPEDAKKAEEEKIILDDLYGKIDFETEEGLEKGKEAIENCPIRIYSKEPYLNGVTEKLNQTIKAREEKELSKLMEHLEDASKAYLIELKDKISTLNFLQISPKEALEYLTDRIDHYELYQKTVDGVVYENQDMADRAKSEKRQCEAILAQIDAENESSILEGMKALENLKPEYFDPKSYVAQVKAMHLAYKKHQLTERLFGLIHQREFAEAMSQLEHSEFSDQDKEDVRAMLNDKINRDFAGEIKRGKEYKEESGEMKNLLIGSVALLVIGFFLSNIISFAFKAAVVIVVIGLAGQFLSSKENEKKKDDYAFVQELLKCGYTVQ